ncbi:MAG TPA: MFS transporter [Candidatus Paceibacterota bacterium]|jgi:MFS family permease|nr:MFS transporter [Candidatus Paceibacterota bacterium]
MKNSRKIIYLAGFLFSVPIALSIYINSSFLSTLISEKSVAIVYALASLSSIIALFLASKIFRKTGGYKFLLLVVFLDALTFLSLSFAKSPLAIIITFILGISLNTLIVFSLDELLKIFSEDSSIGKIRGTYLAACHVAFISAQLASGTILGLFSFRSIYFIGFIIMMLFFFISMFTLKRMPDPAYDRMSAIKYIGEFLKNKNLSRAYILNFLLQFFYSWMVIYTPIYLFLHLGFLWKEIGIIFAIMLLPFIIIPFRIGKYADKIGERKILMFGFAIASLATLSLFFIHQHSIWIWAALLFATRIGAASVEVTSDAYFFKHIKSENEEFVGVYRTATPLADFIGPLCALLVLIFIPSFNFIYPILAALMMYGVYLASTISRNDI